MTPEESLALVAKLLAKLSSQETVLKVVDQYYSGTQALSFLAPEVRQAIGDRLSPLVINWPRTIVDAVQRRAYVEGFRLGQGGTADDELWRMWQANDLDEWSQLAHVDTLVHGRSFLSVWGDDEDPDTPRITVESAHQMAVDYAPGARTVRAALKSWSDEKIQYATLYTPDKVTRYFAKSSVEGLVATKWEVEQVLDNPLQAVPVVPLINRPRVLNLDGESELTDIMPVADAVNKLATDMMVTSEFHATKRRWATGIEIPKAGAQRNRLEAEAREYWDDATKGKTWLAGKDVKFGQFDEASLENFVNAIKLLTSQIAAIGGLPPHFLGINTDNPASADAIRSAESTLVERAREKHQSWGGTYERTMRMAIAVRDGLKLAAVPVEMRRMETIWRDPETPTTAQTADAAVKLFQAGIIDDVQAQENVGLSPVQRQAIADRRSQLAETAATADVVARVNLARELQRTDGLSQNAALAAAGLLAAASQNSADGANPPTAP